MAQGEVVDSKTDKSFYEWLRSEQTVRKWVAIISSALAAIGAVLNFYYKITNQEEHHVFWIVKGSQIVYFSNIAFLIVAICLILFIKSDETILQEEVDKLPAVKMQLYFHTEEAENANTASQRAKVLIQQFKKTLQWFIGFMLLVYILLFIKEYFPDEEGGSRIRQLIDYFITFFNNLGALAIYGGFLIFYQPSVEQRKNKSDNTFDWTVSFSFLYRMWAVALILIIVSVAHFAILFFCMSFSSPEYTNDINTIASIISGFANAIAMILLFARFESPLIKTPVGVLVLLYSYAVAQTMYDLFKVQLLGYSHILQSVTTTLCLIGKCVLVLFVLWIFQTKRLFYYFLVIRNINIREKNNWEEITKLISSKSNN